MKLFATRVWGFGFKRLPLATFGVKGHVDRLLRMAGRGDRLVFVGTQTERTAEEHQGRILGMAEIGFEPLRTLDLVDRGQLDERDFDERGNFKFPYAVATTRVWQFEPAKVSKSSTSECKRIACLSITRRMRSREFRLIKQCFNVAAENGERRAELIRDVGDEFTPHLLQLLQMRDILE